MAKSPVFTLTPAAVLGLFFVQRYRFLTIAQFARASGLSRHRSEDLLRALELRGVLGHFGHVLIPGHGKTPKAYYLKRKGWELLRRESDIPDEFLGSFVETHVEASWSPQMYHRLRLLDLLIALEVQVRLRPRLNLVRTFVEYRRVKRGGRIARETTDFVAAEEISKNRIIPDAAFVLENVETGRPGLFFLEMDMATERIVTRISHDRRLTLRFKIEQYDRYLTGGRFAQNLCGIRPVSSLHAAVCHLRAGAHRQHPSCRLRPALGAPRLLPLRYLRGGRGRLPGPCLEESLPRG
jgi:protein involved in plasmid replication-relaxation